MSLRETVCPTNATNKCVKWTSDKPHIAFVNPDNGFVTAQGTGTAKIRATAQDGSGKYAECTITVKAPIRVTDITKDYISLPRGCENALCKLLDDCNVEYFIEDKRNSGNNISVIFNGVLREERNI